MFGLITLKFISKGIIENSMKEESIEEKDENEEQVEYVYIQELDREIGLSELRVCVLYLKKYNVACGVDEVYTNVLNWGLDWYGKLLVKLFNAVMKLEITPENWSKQILVPVFKKGNKNDTNNYRGLALLSCVGKLFCTIINNRLYNWIEDNEILNEFQAGFRRRRACIDQCFILMSLIQLKISKFQIQSYEGVW